MIQRIIEQAIRNRFLVVMIFLIIGLASVFSIKNAKVDAIPDIGENQQIVFTEWSGRSPKTSKNKLPTL